MNRKRKTGARARGYSMIRRGALNDDIQRATGAALGTVKSWRRLHAAIIEDAELACDPASHILGVSFETLARLARSKTTDDGPMVARRSLYWRNVDHLLAWASDAGVTCRPGRLAEIVGEDDARKIRNRALGGRGGTSPSGGQEITVERPALSEPRGLGRAWSEQFSAAMRAAKESHLSDVPRGTPARLAPGQTVRLVADGVEWLADVADDGTLANVRLARLPELSFAVSVVTR